MKRLIFENFGWKLFSLAAAAVLWIWLVGESEIATSIAVPIQFANFPQDLEISSETIERLHIKVRGPVTRLNQANLAQASVVLDLSPVNSPGEVTFTLDERNVLLPAGLVLTRVIPSQIRVKFERKVSRDVPVEIRFAGPPPSGYRVASVQSRPERLRVSGPESRVQQVDVLQTDPIDIRAAVAEQEFRVPVYVDNPHVHFEGPSSVQVSVRLEKISPSKN